MSIAQLTNLCDERIRLTMYIEALDRAVAHGTDGVERDDLETLAYTKQGELSHVNQKIGKLLLELDKMSPS